MNRMRQLRILTFAVLGFHVHWTAGVVVYSVSVYTRLYGAWWLTGLITVTGVLAFLATPWPVVMNIGWRESGRRVWHAIVRVENPYWVWAAIWLLHLGTVLITAIACIPMCPRLAPWRHTVPPAAIAPSAWIADVLFPFVAGRMTLHLLRATLLHTAFYYVICCQTLSDPAWLISVAAGALAVGITPLLQYEYE